MKFKLNYIVDMAMLLAFTACGLTGVLKLPELAVPVSDGAYLAITALHDWSGIVSLILVLAHVLLHLKWFAGETKNFFSKKTKSTTDASAAGTVAAGTVAAGTPVAAATVAAPASRPKRGLSKSALGLAAFLLFVPIASNLYARPSSNPTIPQGISYPSGSLKDGAYTGTATGFMPGLTVKVTVQNGAIKSVDIVSQNETPRWFTRVSSLIPARVVSAQSTAVDSVSGATCSSEGILSAVENALAKAKK